MFTGLSSPPFNSMKKLAAAAPAAVATLDFTSLITSSYEAFLFLGRLVPATDDVQLWLRTSTNAGGAWDAGAADYKWAALGHMSQPTGASTGSNGDTKIVLTPDPGANFAVGNGAAEGVEFRVLLLAPSSAARKARLLYDVGWYAANDQAGRGAGNGHRDAAADVDGVRFFFESGNIASGQVAMWGLKG